MLILRELHGKIDALVAEAYGWPNDLSDEDILARLVALNAERAAEESAVLCAGCARIPARAGGRGGGTREAAAEVQLEAELVAAAGKEQKPSFPAADVERMAAVYAALAGAHAPLDARAISATFRQGARVEPAVSRILNAWARVGQFHTADGKSFTIRRSA